jgi:hypothetical protein
VRLSPRNARTCSRRECPSVPTNTNALILASQISTRRSPKSICSCRPGGVSNRVVASASAFSACRYGCTARCSVRRLTATPLGQQVLAHDIRIAAMPNKTLAQPTLKAIEQFRPLRRLERLYAARHHVALHRVMAAAQMPRDPLQPPRTPLTATSPPRRPASSSRALVNLSTTSWRDSFLAHSLSPQLSKEGAIPRDAKGAIFHGARQKRTGWFVRMAA